MSQLIVIGAVCCPSCFTNQSCEFLVPEIESETTFAVFPWILNSQKIMPFIARGRPSSETLIVLPNNPVSSWYPKLKAKLLSRFFPGF